MHCISLDSIPGCWRIEADTCGYLLVRGERSLLIDCPVDDLAPLLDAYGLPHPTVIIHTQVQEEHCREWAAFPAAEVHVPADCVEIARCSDEFFTASRTVWPPSREWDSRGQERYGIGGCPTERPPREPLNVIGTLEPGTTFRWEDVALEVLPLPGSGKRAIGLYWRAANIIFSGDLVIEGGYLANLYDLERGYGISQGYDELRASLNTVITLTPAQLLPTSGPIMHKPATSCLALRQRIDTLNDTPTRRATEAQNLINYTPRREFGRYREVCPGIFQNSNFGNIILFVDEQGNGCIIDPDPCVWLSWEENCREVHADLDLLERETGLRRIDTALITHYHGDHVQYCELLRERYGTVVATTPDVAAVMERPWDFQYPCAIDWYGFPFNHVRIDRLLKYDEAYDWRGTPITPIWTPGHCNAHAGYALSWRGQRVVCTGDTLQYGAGPIRLELPILYNDTAWPERGFIATARRLVELQPDLILGGHSHSFFDADGAILRDWLAVAEEMLPMLAELLADGDLTRAMTPPGYDEKRLMLFGKPIC